MFTALQDMYLWCFGIAVIIFVIVYDERKRKMEINRLCHCMIDYIKCNSSNDTLEGIAAACEYLGYNVKFFKDNNKIIGYEISFFNDKTVIAKWIKRL